MPEPGNEAKVLKFTGVKRASKVPTPKGWNGRGGVPDAVMRAIELSAVRSEAGLTGDRYLLVFALARRLHRVPGFNPTTAVLLRVIKEWDGVNRYKAEVRSFADLAGMLRASLGKLAANDREAFGPLLAKAEAMEPPACAAPYGKPEKVLLVKLCLTLDRNAEGKPWHLSVRHAAEAVRTSKSDAARMLKELQEDGVIAVDVKGKQGSSRQPATTWRFAGRVE